MMYQHFFLPLAGLLLVIFQTSVLNIFFMGWLNIEITLILVVFLGFRMHVLPGALLSFLLGFFLDCAMGSISGLYTLIYVCIFFISVLVSMRVYAEQTSLIMGFSFLCSIFESLLIVIFFKTMYNIELLGSLIQVFFPQALVVSMLSPLFFRLFHFFEVTLYGGNPHPAK